MLKHFLLCSSFLALYLVGVIAEKNPTNETHSVTGHIEPIYSLMKAYPQCEAKFMSNETMAKIEKCAPNSHSKSDSNDSHGCCSTMEAMNCTRQILWSIAECKGVRFGLDLFIEGMKFAANECNGTNCINVCRNITCPIVPITKPVVKGILENIFLPLIEVLGKHRDCNQSILEKWIPCFKLLDPVLYGHSFEHPDAVLCGSQWSSYQCFKGLAEKEPKCEVAKNEFEKAFAQMKENVAKKGCPLKL